MGGCGRGVVSGRGSDALSESVGWPGVELRGGAGYGRASAILDPGGDEGGGASRRRAAGCQPCFEAGVGHVQRGGRREGGVEVGGGWTWVLEAAVVLARVIEGSAGGGGEAVGIEGVEICG